jgi:biopolymer transport protein ExbD
LKFKRRLTPDDEAVPMSSMADIAFLLIIFFMVTTVFDVDRGLLIELPETQVRENVETKQLLLSIDADGKLSADGRPITLERVGEYVKAGRRVNPNRAVVVRSDRRVPYGAVTDVMDELLQAGVRDVALPTAAEGEGSE